MATVAEQLQQAREAQKLTIDDVADYTKIRIDHVRALDEGNYDVFSAPVYIRGFVRSYAGMLKLDVPQILEQLSAELSGSTRHHEPPPLSKARSGVLDGAMYQLSKLNWRMLVGAVVGAVILVTGFVAYTLWNNHKSSNPIVQMEPKRYAAPANNGDSLPLPKR